MENANHNIDEIFRQRLHDAEVPPPPFVWPAVEQELRKRRRGWVLWLFVFGTVAAAGLWLWQIQTSQKDLLSTINTEKDIQSPTQGADTALPTQANAVETNFSNTPEPLSSAPISTPDSKGSRVLPVEVHHLETSKGKKSSQKTASNAPADIAVQMVGDAVNLVSPSDGRNELSVVFASSKEAIVLPSNLPLINLQAKAVTSILQKKTISSPHSFKSFSKRKKPQPKVCYDFTRHPNAWLLDVYAGPSLAQRSLTSLPDNQPYLNQRLATEHRDVAMNAGIRASFMFNGNILARTGLHYEQMTEVFEYFDPTTAIYSVQWNAQLNKIDTLGVVYGESYLKSYNRYAMLDIPLLVGMEMRKGRSGFSLNAGISANILFKKRGVIMDPNSSLPARFGPIPEKVGPDILLSEDVFRTNMGLSAMATIQWYWHVTPTFRVFAEPAYRQVLRPVTLKSHPVEQRYSLFSLRLGATKIF